MTKILIVEDEMSMRTGLRDNLEFEGYEVDTAEDGQAGLSMIMENSYDLVLLDVMLPKMSGFDVCKILRGKQVFTPIIMLTAKGDEIDKVLGLEIGADDYITKPFSLRELLARIKAALRRTEFTGNNSTGTIEIGRLKLEFQSYNAWENEEPVSLTHKEFEILKYFWDKKNQTVSRNDLLEKVWGYDQEITTRTIDNFILKLRQKIEKNPSHPKYILTVHGIGYKLVN
ncbi:MAG: response regulator transcription factor [Candidatus Marinimicrobia bacterium]|nr:response regulator transcription factor [Candidatus Neomarinimicrobiota bacterium]